MTLPIFSRTNLDAIVNQIDPPTPGKTVRIVSAVDETGAKVALAVKLAAGGPVTWELAGAWHYDWTGDVGGGLQTIVEF